MTRDFLLPAVLLILCAMPSLAVEPLVVATLEWPPYVGEEYPDQGYAAEVIRQAFAEQGLEVHFEFLPWARVRYHADRLMVDAYGPEYSSADLGGDYLFSNPFPGGSLVFFKRKDRDISYERLEDLEPYRIGVVRGYVNTEGFDRADYLRKEEAADDLANLRKLARSRVDLVLIDLNVARSLLPRMDPALAVALEPMLPVLEEKSLHLCFNKRHPRARELLAAFNAGLEALRGQGRLKAIAERYGIQVE